MPSAIHLRRGASEPPQVQRAAYAAEGDDLAVAEAALPPPHQRGRGGRPAVGLGQIDRTAGGGQQQRSVAAPRQRRWRETADKVARNAYRASVSSECRRCHNDHKSSSSLPAPAARASPRRWRAPSSARPRVDPALAPVADGREARADVEVERLVPRHPRVGVLRAGAGRRVSLDGDHGLRFDRRSAEKAHP